MHQSGFKDTVLRQSYVFNTGNGNVNRSFISTAVVSDSLAYGDDLRKSRIQNLPNYRKTNLGDNVQFIVVFQTIEIERLSQEIQVLRIKLKQSQRQLFNAANHQVQIRQLTQKCFSQEKQIYEYRQEYEKLNKICETLYHQNQMLKNKLSDIDFSLQQKYQAEQQRSQELKNQIEKWKSRYQAAEKSKLKQLEDLRALMDSQRKSMVDRQIRQMTIRFQNQRSTLENQIRKCRDLLDSRNRQVDDLRQKNQKQQILIMELRNYQNLLNDHENKLALTSQQLLRLNDLLRQKEDDNASLKQQEFKLSQQLKQLQEWQTEGKKLRNQLDSKTRQVDEWKARSSRLEQQIVRAKQLQHYNEELGNKLNLASKQLERLNGILRGKLDEIESWKKKVNDRESQLSKYKNLENDLYSYESKINNLKIENDRINGILKSRLGQIQDWKGKYSTLQHELDKVNTLQQDKKTLEDRVGSQVRANEELKFQIGNLQSQVNSLRRYEQQLKEAERNSAGLTKEVERLNGLLKNQAGQLNDFRIRYSKVEGTLSEYKNIEVKLRDYEHKINLQTTELQKLNDLLKERNRQLAQLQKEKLELHGKISHLKNYELKISENQQMVARMQDSNNNLKREIENWQNKFREADAKSRDFENHLFRNNQEKQKLSNMVKTKNNDYEQLRTQYARLEPEIRRKNQLQMALQEQQNHLMGLTSDIEGYDRKLRSTQQELEKEKAFTNEFAFKVIVLSGEIERLNQEGAINSKHKSKQFLELQQNYSRLQSKVATKNNQIDLLINKINSLESKINQISSDFNRILTEATKSQQQTRALAKQIEEYQDYARRIHILGAEIDRLRSQNKGFDEDIRKMRLKYSQNMNWEKKEEAFNLRTVLMALEIQSLRRRIDQREMSVEQMRKSILEPVRRI